MFYPRKFLTKAEEGLLIDTIVRAEKKTSGEIRVHLQSELDEDVISEAISVFDELGMENTKLRNGVFIFIVPNKRQFAIIGDKGINDVVPDEFWDDVKNSMIDFFKQGKLAEGIIFAVEKAGEKLSKFFPLMEDDINELSNEITYG